MKNEVVKNIKAGMAYAGEKSKGMAKACGVSDRTWRNWMKKPETITLPYLYIIAATLGVKPSELLEEHHKGQTEEDFKNEPHR